MSSGDDVDGTRLRVAHGRTDPVSLQGGDGDRQDGVELAGQASQFDEESGGGEDDGAQPDHDRRLLLGDVGSGVADGGVELQASLGLKVWDAVREKHKLEVVKVLQVRHWLVLVPPRLCSQEVTDLWNVEHGELQDASRDLVESRQ